MVVEDAIKISRMKLKEQLEIQRFGSYEKLLPADYDFLFCNDMFMNLKNVFKIRCLSHQVDSEKYIQK